MTPYERAITVLMYLTVVMVIALLYKTCDDQHTENMYQMGERR